MGRLGLAFRAFFRVLSNRTFAEMVRQLMLPLPPVEAQAKPAETKRRVEPAPKRPRRNDAVQLLAALQREGRLVDFLMEPIAGYADEQIGAAVRNVHRDCRAALERVFALRPLMDQQEGTTIEVPPGFDAARIRLTGQVTGQPPYRGTLEHAGWLATKCELPEWTGSDEAVMVVAAAEVEVKS